ncbi:MAG: hypothetical protein Q3982_01335 [Phoenicibacter congonensis]|uniref:Oxidoreductase molybdopterin-binding domain-containing protein n=1 Tax=Phoenicibacter congonensis TaxID=1944646 RepID=A0AA43RKU6_9ACTN|nr:hypothetical protein [Phoenicibacter congonensis]
MTAETSENIQAIDPYRLPDPHSREKKKLSRKVLIALLSTVLAVLLGFALYFSWQYLRNPEIDAYADEPIQLVGLDDSGDIIQVTPKQLSQFHCEQLTVSGVGMGTGGVSKAGVVNVYGPEINTVLAYFGYSTTDFRRIKFECKDGYKVTLRGDQLTYKIYLSIASGKDALYDKQQPLRIVIPDEQSGRWAYGVTKIEFVQ